LTGIVENQMAILGFTSLQPCSALKYRKVIDCDSDRQPWTSIVSISHRMESIFKTEWPTSTTVTAVQGICWDTRRVVSSVE